MGRIIDFNAKLATRNTALSHAHACDHKEVTVYAADRKVYCNTCGAILDPMDVLVDMVQRMAMTSSRKHLNEVEKFDREWERRLHAVRSEPGGKVQPE